ncbi:exported hypothetical protein [Rhodospirillaceae bacterium LM-1]|nr:exported hypothetical protein [Rhodospirillaceae bacterium LM-1]
MIFASLSPWLPLSILTLNSAFAKCPSVDYILFHEKFLASAPADDQPARPGARKQLR